MISLLCLIILHEALLIIAALDTSLPKKTCYAGPDIDRNLCDFSMAQQIEADHSVHPISNEELSSVPDGTSCFLKLTPKTGVNVQCQAGNWVFADSWNKQVEFPRTKRSTKNVLTWTGTQVAEVTDPLTIHCPSINTPIYTGRGMVSTSVKWKNAVVNNSEYDSLRVKQIQGQQPGSQHDEGDHVVSYIAWDNMGQPAFCSVSFTVVVRRCPHEFTYLLNGSAACTLNDRYIYGSECFYSCNPGFELVGKRSLQCMDTGAWSDNKPYCKAISCGFPVEIEHGIHVCESNQFSFMTKCEIICDVGYKVIGQSDVIICEASGRWTSAGLCQVKMCQELEIVQNSTVICSNDSFYGSTCHFICNQNYTLQGGGARTCQDNQTWSGSQPECVRVCTEPATVSHGRYECENGAKYQDVCSLTCDKGYKVTGPHSITCGSNFQWTDGGFCEDVDPPVPVEDCPPDMEIRASIFGSPNFVYYSVPGFTDNSGEKIDAVGKPSTGSDFPLGSTTVLIVASDSARNNFTCQFVITVVGKYCGDPNLAVSTSDPMHFQCPDGFVYGTVCNASCSNGTEPQGVRIIKCDLNTYYNEPEWSSGGDIMPYCQNQCNPGQYSSTGQQPCQICEVGTYQADYGSTKCELCPYSMTTSIYGAVSKDQCKFISIYLVPEAAPIIHLNDTYPKSFTIMTWVQLFPQKPKTILNFTIRYSEAPQGSAYFQLDGFAVYLIPIEYPTLKSVRYWYHMAFVFDEQKNGLGTLYVNGKYVDSEPNLLPSSLSQQSFKIGIVGTVLAFLKNPVMVTGFQMTQAALTLDQVKEFYNLCGKVVSDNILATSEIQTGSLTTCDDFDNCEDSPCGLHGTCIDGVNTFTCDCDKPWSGKTCQIPPNFCLNHTCANGATCVDSIQNMNFTCVCPEGYKGPLCKDKIVNGGWGMWNEWSVCSKVCGSGERLRIRACDSPRPDSSGRSCYGDEEEQQKCFGNQCPVDGMFGEWSDWSSCSSTCGVGEQYRRRTCDNPAPSNGGSSCVGISDARIQCNEFKCPECPPLVKRSGHQLLDCKKNSDQSLTTCQIVCNPGMAIAPKIMNEFQCGYLTNYIWTHQTGNNPTAILPDCGEVTLPTKTSLMVNYEYENVTCSTAQSSNNFTHSIEQKILDELNCSNQSTCNYEISVIGACAENSPMSGILKVEYDYAAGLESGTSAIELSQNFYNDLKQIMNKLAKFLLESQTGAGYMSHMESAQLILQCPNGTGYIGDVCVGCPPGSYSAGNRTCKFCENGYYQDQARTDSCIHCPGCGRTVGTGSYLLNQCEVECQAAEGDSSTSLSLIIGVSAGIGCLFIIATISAVAIRKKCKRRSYAHPYNIPGPEGEKDPYEEFREDIYDTINDPYISADGYFSAESTVHVKPICDNDYTELVGSDQSLSACELRVYQKQDEITNDVTEQYEGIKPNLTDSSGLNDDHAQINKQLYSSDVSKSDTQDASDVNINNQELSKPQSNAEPEVDILDSRSDLTDVSNGNNLTSSVQHQQSRIATMMKSANFQDNCKPIHHDTDGNSKDMNKESCDVTADGFKSPPIPHRSTHKNIKIRL